MREQVTSLWLRALVSKDIKRFLFLVGFLFSLLTPSDNAGKQFCCERPAERPACWNTCVYLSRKIKVEM